jgi:hypothetical protein
MFATSSFATVFNLAVSDTGYMVGLVVAAVTIGVVALMGLGFGIRHLKKWITGKKF